MTENSPSFGQPLPASVAWFEEHSDWVFDELGVPRGEFGVIFRVLARARLLQAIRSERDPEADGGRVMERGRFVLELQDALRGLRFQPTPVVSGTIDDLSSSGRLSQIWRVSLDMATGFARWKSQRNEVSLRRAPAQELLRGADCEQPRDWPQIWKAAGGKFYRAPGEGYPQTPGHMIALKTDPVWARISRFGLPWSPSDLDGDRVERNVRRRDALALRSVPDGEPLMRADDPPQEQGEFSVGKGAARVIDPRSSETQRLLSEFDEQTMQPKRYLRALRRMGFRP